VRFAYHGGRLVALDVHQDASAGEVVAGASGGDCCEQRLGMVAVRDLWRRAVRIETAVTAVVEVAVVW